MFAILRADGIECGMCRMLHDTWTDAWACCSGFVLFDDTGEYIVVAATEFPAAASCFSSGFASFVGTEPK